MFIGDPSDANGIATNIYADLVQLFGGGTTGTTLTDDILTAINEDQFAPGGSLAGLTPDDLYPTTIYTLAGDGVAQFQQDFESGGLLGTIEGLFLQHVEYLGLTPDEIADATITTNGADLTYVDIPDNFNNADAWLSAVFEHGAAGSGLLESVFQSLELYLTNSF